MNSRVLEVIRVNHGKVFGGDDEWYTFYCPNCESLLEIKSDCPHCKQVINWKLTSKKEKK